MIEAVEFTCSPIGIRLPSSLEYHEIVFGGENLVEKESDFRTNKLSMILEVLWVLRIPEELKTELCSAIIAAWRLKIPGSTREQLSKERDMILKRIHRIKCYVHWAKDDPETECRLDLAVLSALPLMSEDLEPGELPKVQSLLSSTKNTFHRLWATAILSS
jgi:hypothetical protein